MSEKNFGYRDLKHKTLTQLTEGPGTIEDQAAQNGHDGFLPTPVSTIKNGKEVIRGNGNPVSVPDTGQRGRIIIFIPTKERVTVLRQRIGQTYNGILIHEVTTRDGRLFLASETQLKDLE